MKTSFRLHLASNVRVADDFASRQAVLETRATALLQAGMLDDETAWELAQYVDITDAGYGSRTGLTYRQAVSALGAYVRGHLQRPKARAMFGRSAALARLVEKTLDDQVAVGAGVEETALAA